MNNPQRASMATDSWRNPDPGNEKAAGIPTWNGVEAPALRRIAASGPPASHKTNLAPDRYRLAVRVVTTGGRNIMPVEMLSYAELGEVRVSRSGRGW
jgi:hypothetical protein